MRSAVVHFPMTASLFPPVRMASSVRTVPGTMVPPPGRCRAVFPGRGSTTNRVRVIAGAGALSQRFDKFTDDLADRSPLFRFVASFAAFVSVLHDLRDSRGELLWMTK